MAENPATQDSVSREAHTRVVSERDQYKAQVETLQRQVTEASTTFAALEAFSTNRPEAGVADILKATKVALPHLAGLEGDDLAAKVKSEFDFLIPQEGTPQAPTNDGDGDGNNDPKVPTADTKPAPGWAQPTPTGQGEQPSSQKFDPLSPEMRQLRERSPEEFKRLDREGQIAWRTAELPAGFGPNPNG